MPFLQPSLTTLQREALSNVSNGLPGLNPSLLPISNKGALAMVEAGLARGHYAYLDWIARQAVPFTCDNEFLEAWAALKGIIRKAPSPASGTVTLTGAATTLVPQGTRLSRSDGVIFITTDVEVTDLNGIVNVPVTALASGSAGNSPAGISLTVQSAITGIDPTGTASTLSGGADIETDDSLRTRMLIQYAKPPNGGSASDYAEWALEVPGITRAWAVPNQMGLGTVAVYFMEDVTQALSNGFPQGGNGAAPQESRLSTATGDQLILSQHIYPLRPVTAAVWCAAPIPLPVNITVANLNPITADIESAIQQAIIDLFRRIGDPTGVTLYQSDVTSAIDSVPGIKRYSLVTPFAPTVVPVGSIPVLGSVAFA